MNVQLLLLLALAGPFCAFTHASPTAVPTDLDVGTTAAVADLAPVATDAPLEDLTVITGPPATDPQAAPEEVATEAATHEVPTAFTVNTEEPVAETEAPTAAATEAPAIVTDQATEPPAVETAAPTVAEVQTVVTAAAEAGPGGDVIIEDNSEVTEGSLSSGQVVGIVIGALLAVVIVIAVVIAAVRRMGKYSSAKIKKPSKKVNVMVSPLRKKPAKQQERPKFWKF